MADYSKGNKFTTITDPTDFKDSALKELDRLLRCPICYEFYVTPMILPCSHSFCSLCIRRYLQYKNTCPSCMQVTSTTALVSNIALGQITTEFTKNRSTILSLSRPGVPETPPISLPSSSVPTSAPIDHYETSKSKMALKQNRQYRTRTCSTQSTATVNSAKTSKKYGTKCEVDRKEIIDNNTAANTCTSDDHLRPHLHVSIDTATMATNLTESSVVDPNDADLKHQSKATVSSDQHITDEASTTVALPPVNFILESETIEELNFDSHLIDDQIRDDSEQDDSQVTPQQTVKQEPSIDDVDKAHGCRFDLTPPLLGGSSPFDNNLRPLCFGDYSQKHVRLGIKEEEEEEGKDDNMMGLGSTSMDNDRTPDLKEYKSVNRRSIMGNNEERDVRVDSAECPVCGIQVLNKHMNNHLDICLKYSNTRQQPTTSIRSSYVLPKLPKLCYAVMKDNQLRQKLRDYHLPSTGSRSLLISRLKEFTLQYNAQYDSTSPKTMKEIAAEVEVMEKAKSTPRKKQTFGVHLSKNSTMEEVGEECKKYVIKHTDQFDDLITGVRKRLLSTEDVGVSAPNELSPTTNNRDLVKPRKRKKTLEIINDPDFEI